MTDEILSELRPSHSVARLTRCLWWACALEATAPKPGNVHPHASFDDLTYEDFLRSASAIAPIVAGARECGIGATVESAVQATRRQTPGNTNLGIILLLTPLAAVPGDVSLPVGIANVLERLSVADAQSVYRAIRLAQPAGLGSVESEDVTGEPTVSLLEAMKLAADHDDVAAQYATGFDIVLNEGVSHLVATDDFAECWQQAIVGLHLRLMAGHPDTLIARKCGQATAVEASTRARAVLEAGWPNSRSGQALLQEFDAWLRADGNRRNPGTSADLVAASLFAGFRDGHLPEPNLEGADCPALLIESLPDA
jgi:triphosphoribosyl-dephospho-CoA synthase